MRLCDCLPTTVESVGDKVAAYARSVNDVAPRGWFAKVPPNGRVARPAQQVNNHNVAGLSASEPDIVIETTPEHRNLIAGDRDCVGWTRQPDDPGVVARRAHLLKNNGIASLEMVIPGQVDRATELFHRDGFVVVVDALTGERLEALKTATDRVVDEILQVDPDGSVGGGAGGLAHRYSYRFLRQELDELTAAGSHQGQDWWLRR